jgi:hypothetical protein
VPEIVTRRLAVGAFELSHVPNDTQERQRGVSMLGPPPLRALELTRFRAVRRLMPVESGVLRGRTLLGAG